LHQREQAYETCLRRLALSPPRTLRAAEWIRTTTTRSLKTLTLPLVYGGMKTNEPSLGVEPSPPRYQRGVPSRGHFDGSVTVVVDSIGIEPIAAALQVQLAPLEHGYPFRDPSRNRTEPNGTRGRRQSPCVTRCTWDQKLRRAAGAIRTLTSRGLSSSTLPLVYGGAWWGCWDLHPVGLVAAALQAASVVSTVNIPLGWPMGLAPIYSRFTASRLVGFGIDHSPP
jgi:hypothetical protein